VAFSRFMYWRARIDRGSEVMAPGDGTGLMLILDAPKPT